MEEGEIPSNSEEETRELHYGIGNKGTTTSWHDRGEESREIL